MIDTSKDFSKHVGSHKKAWDFVRQLAKDNNVSLPSMTTQQYGRSIYKAFGENELFSFNYWGNTKQLSVSYKDGREKSTKEIKPSTYCYIWVEGLSPERGEKISAVTDNGFEYTTKITESIRIRKNDLERFKRLMKSFGIADWVINGNAFIPTSYAPKGTLYNF